MQLEMAARDKIKNLHMFVSPTRLVVHNLPPSVNDKQLKSLCFTATNDVDAKIVEVCIFFILELFLSERVQIAVSHLARYAQIDHQR